MNHEPTVDLRYYREDDDTGVIVAETHIDFADIGYSVVEMDGKTNHVVMKRETNDNVQTEWVVVDPEEDENVETLSYTGDGGVEAETVITGEDHEVVVVQAKGSKEHRAYLRKPGDTEPERRLA